jgi:hypothetical protein
MKTESPNILIIRSYLSNINPIKRKTIPEIISLLFFPTSREFDFGMYKKMSRKRKAMPMAKLSWWVKKPMFSVKKAVARRNKNILQNFNIP